MHFSLVCLFLFLTLILSLPSPASFSLKITSLVHTRTQTKKHSAVLLNVTDPTNRGTALALLTVLDDVGRGAGPFVVAQAASRFGRRATFAWSTLGWVLCGVVFAAGGVTLRRDELAMQERLRRQVLEAVDEALFARREGVNAEFGANTLVLEAVDVEDGGGGGGGGGERGGSGSVAAAAVAAAAGGDDDDDCCRRGGAAAAAAANATATKATPAANTAPVAPPSSRSS